MARVEGGSIHRCHTPDSVEGTDVEMQIDLTFLGGEVSSDPVASYVQERVHIEGEDQCVGPLLGVTRTRLESRKATF